MVNLSLHSKFVDKVNETFRIRIEEMHDKYLDVDVVAKQQESFPAVFSILYSYYLGNVLNIFSVLILPFPYYCQNISLL